MGVSRISPGDPVIAQCPPRSGKSKEPEGESLDLPMEGRGEEQRITNERAQKKSETESGTLPATSDICTARRPVWKVPEIPPTSRSARSECPSFGSHDSSACLGEQRILCQGWGNVRGVCGTLPRSLLSLASLGTRGRGGLCGQVSALGSPSFQSAPIPHGGGSYLGSTAVRVSKVREGHCDCP